MNLMIENKKSKELVKIYCDECGDYLVTDHYNALHYCALCSKWSKAERNGDNGNKTT